MTRQEQITKAATAKSRGETPYFFDAFVAGAEWADEHPHWISVEDELPENYRGVIIAISHHFCYTAFRCGDKWYLNDVINPRELPSATHWMPMPQPPIVSKMENTEKKGGAQ